MPTVVVLPFHQDERLSGRSIVLPTEVSKTVVEPLLPAGDQWKRLVVLYDHLAAQVASHITASNLTTVVTGDCLALLGTLTGAQRAGFDPSVVWFDAHGDVHTLATSTSGYLGGMALRMAVGGDADKLTAPLGLKPLAEERAVLVDARDLDPAEADYLATARIQRRSVHDIRPEHVPDGPVILHVDVDVIDSSEVPGLRFPVAAGPSISAVLSAVHRLMAGGRVIVLDVACPWLEPVDDGQQQVRRRLLGELLNLPSGLVTGLRNDSPGGGPAIPSAKISPATGHSYGQDDEAAVAATIEPA